MPDLVEHARQLAGRADWRFETVRDIAIPERDHAADFVCFFSVFTHLGAADCYPYLIEAARVARPRGRIGGRGGALSAAPPLRASYPA